MAASSRADLPSRVETVLFDAGGVLLDLDYAFLRELIEERGLAAEAEALSRAEALARAEIHRRVQQGARVSGAWRAYFELVLQGVGVGAAHHAPIIDTLWDTHRRIGLWTRAIDGALAVVDRLREAGLRVGVVSNAEGQVARDLDRAGFVGRFETVVDSCLVGVEKPDPRIFRIALDRMRIEAESTVFVGDLPSVDVEGARAAGIPAILIDRHDLYADLDVPRARAIDEVPALVGLSDPQRARTARPSRP
jgi:putative hydrolase of the HAD superfamily